MNDLFLRACRGESVERTPLWIMRQAGRYLPEYREVRAEVDFLTLCRTPELACKVTLQPIERFGLDAAILFSDILTLAEPLGFDVEFNPGPVIGSPVRAAADVERIRHEGVEEQLGFVYDAIRMLRRELDGRAPLIGFAGSPFTVAAYLVEGRGSKNFDQIKRLIFADPATAHALLEKVARATASHLRAQIEAGVQAVQLFDSWAGLLSPAAYAEFGLRYARLVLDELRDAGVPRIYFALNSAHLLPAIRDCDAEVVGLDWRVPIDEGSAALDHRFSVQGNLDPCVLFAPPAVIEAQVAEIVRRAAGLPGHVFNLGHGILPTTPIEHVEALVSAVRRLSAQTDGRA